MRLRAIVATVALTGGAGLLGHDAWLAAKAALAARLIDGALDRHLDDGGVHRPWSWADTHPIARLAVPRLGIERTVLSGSSGAVLAFGPGHVPGTPPPGAAGNSAIAGHRDGSFAFLRELRPGDRIDVDRFGGSVTYEVAESFVVDMHTTEVLAPSGDDRLTLITCHPFGSVLPSDRRYVVVARRTAILCGRSPKTRRQERCPPPFQKTS